MTEKIEVTEKIEMTEEQKAQSFIGEYNELCKKHGFQLTAQPGFVPTNHGSFEISVQIAVAKIAKE